MDADLLDVYERASAWTASKVAGAANKLDAPTPCDDWTVATLMNHMLDTQRYFIATGLGEDAALPSPTPPDLIGEDPVAAFATARAEMLRVYGAPGIIEKTGPSLAIAFSDQLIHGWDLANATLQDQQMPEGLPEAAFDMIYGRFTDDQREGVFKPEVRVASNASAQDKLLAYTGRDPSQPLHKTT